MFDLASPHTWFQLSRLVSTITPRIKPHPWFQTSDLDWTLTIFWPPNGFNEHTCYHHSSITPRFNHLLFQPSLSIMYHTWFQPSNLISTITCGFRSHSFFHHHIWSQSSHLGSTPAVSTVAPAFNHNTWLWQSFHVSMIWPVEYENVCCSANFIINQLINLVHVRKVKNRNLLEEISLTILVEEQV